jgi:hypothetical protein
MVDIVIGDRVRSFDFANGEYGRDLDGERACYAEGEIVGFDHIEGCDRYRILVDRGVFGGEDCDRQVGRLITPPVNGTPKSFGGVCDFVECL